jgi:hypothetical protein
VLARLGSTLLARISNADLRSSPGRPIYGTIRRHGVGPQIGAQGRRLEAHMIRRTAAMSDKPVSGAIVMQDIEGNEFCLD